MDMIVEQVRIEDLKPDPRNARVHGERNIEAIRKSLEEFGQRKPIVVHKGVVIAGNGTVEAAKLLGWDRIGVVYAPDGWPKKKAAAFAIADNRTAELAEWDDQMLQQQLGELSEMEALWSALDVDAGSLDEFPETENPYTSKINIPHYEVTGDVPSVDRLCDDTKAKQLQAAIEESSASEEEKQFLIMAAQRHVRFHYGRIAEFYAAAPPNIQRLMEESALVIIDADLAIAEGYTDFTDTLREVADL